MSVSEKSLRMSVSNEREKGVSQMSGFQDIVGHKQIIEHLKNAEKMNKVSHAYIFSGEKYFCKNGYTQIIGRVDTTITPYLMT